MPSADAPKVPPIPPNCPMMGKGTTTDEIYFDTGTEIWWTERPSEARRKMIACVAARYWEIEYERQRKLLVRNPNWSNLDLAEAAMPQALACANRDAWLRWGGLV